MWGLREKSALCGSEVLGLSKWNDPVSREGLGGRESAFGCSESEMPVGYPDT